MKSACLLLIFLLNFTNHANSSEWIDVSDMTDPRLLRNRYRHSASSFDHAAYKEMPYSKEDPLRDAPQEDSRSSSRDHQHVSEPQANQQHETHDHGDSIVDYMPKNPFPGTDSCLDRSLADSSTPEDPEVRERMRANRLDCISDELRKNTNVGKEEKIEPEQEAKSDPAVCGDRPSIRPEQLKKFEADTKMLHSCLAKNKQLTEDLICYRNLKSLYTRHFAKIRTVIDSMQHDQRMIEIHPYSAEFHILVQTMNHENCLTAVDDLEKVITKIDRFLSRIEPVDWSKRLIYGGIVVSIVFCFYYIYRFMKLKYLVFTLLLFTVWAHEYYHLLLAKKAEISHTLRKYERCQETGVFVSVWSFLFKDLQSTVSFKGDECDRLNEHYLYIDAAFKINPLEPVFTVLPKLFSKSLIIVLENSAIAFSKFCAQLPLFHAYPILILFLALLLSIVYLLLSWHVKLRTVEHDREIRIRQLENGKHPMISGEPAASRLTASERKSITSGSRLNDRLDGDAGLSNDSSSDSSGRTEDSNRTKESDRTDADRRTKTNCSALDRSSRFNRLDRNIRTTPQGDSLARALRRTKSLDFIPAF